MIVLDASAAVDYATGTQRATGVWSRLRDEPQIFVPAHFDVECGAAIRRQLLRGGIEKALAHKAIAFIRGLPAERIPLTPMLDHAFELRDRIGMHDAFYAVLAASLDAPLLTCDAALGRALEGLVEAIVVA